MDELEMIVKKYVQALFAKDRNIGEIILGCTHYAIIENIFRKYIPKNIRIISQGKIIAEKLKDYLARHGEIERELRKERKRIFLTTKNSQKIKHLACLFYGKDINVKIVRL
jgi:glutamate racemase